MKNLIALLFLATLSVTAAIANGPAKLDGLYITTQSYNYDYNKDEWIVSNITNQKFIVDTQNGLITLDNKMFSIVKMKDKFHKKTGVQEFEMRLVDENNETCIAVLIIAPDKNNVPVMQLYLSNAETESSFDLTR